MSAGVRSQCTSTAPGSASGVVAASSRSMPMTGVMPLPAVTNSSFSGTGSGSTNSPAGGPIRSSVPTGVCWASAPDTAPPGTAVTVMASSGSPGRDVAE